VIWPVTYRSKAVMDSHGNAGTAAVARTLQSILTSRL